MHHNPPQLAQRFLRWFLRDDLAEEVQGDLEEQFDARLEKNSLFRAKLNYWYQVCNYLRPFAIKHIKSANSNYYPMFRHNFIISFRNFKRYKTSFFINLMGLSTGLACALLIYLWVNDELSIDHFNEKDSQLYQVMQNRPNADGIRTIEFTQGLLAKALAEEMPEVEAAVSVIPASWFSSTGILSFEKTRIKTKGQYVGNDFFRFSLMILYREIKISYSTINITLLSRKNWR